MRIAYRMRQNYQKLKIDFNKLIEELSEDEGEMKSSQNDEIEKEIKFIKNRRNSNKQSLERMKIIGELNKVSKKSKKVPSPRPYYGKNDIYLKQHLKEELFNFLKKFDNQ